MPCGSGRKTKCSMIRPAMPMASDALSPTAEHSSRSSSKRAPETSRRDRNPLLHSRVRGTIRIVTRSGTSSGKASATWRARSQLRHAAALSRTLAHSPARRCQT
ncbi:hypothetical protein LAUMK13_03164 [Mycobacterium innocens]|uniref:Uncharacterized protein n=1 Tax=Mycobacterium innocens TaxID=2341083 RepID=A0A498Q5S5_9MYCO|nr:hypothetical protein LAUMK13_03164 [Mycobacterium innocens]